MDTNSVCVDTEDLYTIGFQKVAGRYGKEFTFGLKCKIMGQQSKEFSETIINELELPLTVDEFLKETRAIFEDLFPQCKVMPGVKKLLNHLHINKIPIGLATSSTLETYIIKTVNHQELFDLFPYKTWGSSDPEVKKGKPSADIFLVAAAKFPEKPSVDKISRKGQASNACWSRAHASELNSQERNIIQEAPELFKEVEEAVVPDPGDLQGVDASALINLSQFSHTPYTPNHYFV